MPTKTVNTKVITWLTAITQNGDGAQENSPIGTSSIMGTSADVVAIFQVTGGWTIQKWLNFIASTKI
ncbi:hypothetical protein BTUL_0275g00190 [Botrytis tulipae]|uniref:Uncharacterized protein n=1 Tax=Botrytis tulipae TaxID=87230 RepID=A0A4Z1EDS1_9HELO|nr:hypothetical protein BTUL_0275g00190 [Botrytis tulipae]